MYPCCIPRGISLILKKIVTKYPMKKHMSKPKTEQIEVSSIFSFQSGKQMDNNRDTGLNMGKHLNYIVISNGTGMLCTEIEIIEIQNG